MSFTITMSGVFAIFLKMVIVMYIMLEPEHVNGAERRAIPAPRSGGCLLIRSAAQSCARTLRSKPALRSP